ncbi:hypothetical protein JI739_06550 [Ramlibacter sp. AW1]|uniref:Uncharacterized protein n=1 Tax=Ramlibacter aurantiacus TaxID=2801330 RepID=A0A936ZMG7_9BURK|nr:hypothetical protein [Ramlibacter aurantiacus]MBL0420003.1 hypothetical protein [Ramlibacter aurantiacus]
MERWRAFIPGRPGGTSPPGGRKSLLSGPVVLTVLISAWGIGLLSAGADPWPAESHDRWDMLCPDCGTVEMVANLREPNGPGRAWRIYVRMSSGTLRQMVQDAAFEPGQRVVVEGKHIRRVGEPWLR